jgi:hypothetical protein
MPTNHEQLATNIDRAVQIQAVDTLVAVDETSYATRAYMDSTGNSVVYAKDASFESEFAHISPKLANVLMFAATIYNDDNLRAVATKIENKEFDYETNLYADILAAALLIGTDGLPNKEFNTHALDEFFAFCSGDEHMVQSLLFRSLHLEDMYEVRKAKAQEQSTRHAAEYGSTVEVDPSDIVLVHVTNHEPVLDENGNVIVRPTGNYEDVARATVHFTVNSIVKNHASGNAWQGEDRYTLVVNLADVLKQGSVPTVIHGVDTYFAINPGENLVLPNAVIIHDPAKSDEAIDAEVYDAIKQKGASEVYKAGQHYLEGGYEIRAVDFTKGLAELAVRLDAIPGSLHIDSQEGRLETAFITSSIVQENIFVDTYLSNPLEAIRWAMLHGQFPTLHRVPSKDDDMFI